MQATCSYSFLQHIIITQRRKGAVLGTGIQQSLYPYGAYILMRQLWQVWVRSLIFLYRMIREDLTPKVTRKK